MHAPYFAQATQKDRIKAQEIHLNEVRESLMNKLKLESEHLGNLGDIDHPEGMTRYRSYVPKPESCVVTPGDVFSKTRPSSFALRCVKNAGNNQGAIRYSFLPSLISGPHRGPVQLNLNKVPTQSSERHYGFGLGATAVAIMTILVCQKKGSHQSVCPHE